MTPSMTPGAVPALEAREVTVRYGGVMALDSVSMTVESGSITGLIGPNGAGKTTFVDTVSGFTGQISGQIEFHGDPIDALPPHMRSRRGLVRTFQSLELFDDLTIGQNLLVAAGTPSAWSTLTDAIRWKRTPQPQVDTCLELLGLADVADRFPTEVSNGVRHLVAIARALVPQPTLVLLDEPAAGLDSHETSELAGAIMRIREKGVSVLLVDHDMSLVLGICDRVHVLDYGKVIASGTPSEIKASPRVIDAYLGTGRTAG